MGLKILDVHVAEFGTLPGQFEVSAFVGTDDNALEQVSIRANCYRATLKMSLECILQRLVREINDKLEDMPAQQPQVDILL